LARWLVSIAGAEHYYPMFPRAFAFPDLSVTSHHELGFVLSSTELDECKDIDALRPVAQELVEVLNGFARLVWPGVPASQASAAFELDDAGTVVHRAILAGVRLYVLAGGSGTPEEAILLDQDRSTPFPGPIRQSVIRNRRDPALRTALRVYGSIEPGWAALYKIVEVLDRERIVSAGLATRAALERFAAAANNSSASGLEARHIQPWPSPPSPMTLAEARGLVYRILVQSLGQPPAGGA
jgi:hypothetical protein